MFSRIIEAIENKVMGKEIQIDANNFLEIQSKESNNKIVFIDGGQAELWKAVDFSLQFIRTAAITLQNNKRINSVIHEFFVLITAEEENYTTEIFPVKGLPIDNITVHAMDASIREGNEKASISKIGNIIRRFAELELAKQTMNKLEKEDVIVLDGSLKCMVPGEKEKMSALSEKAEESEIILSSLAKTNKLTKQGISIASQLHKEGTWLFPLEDEEHYATGIAKLNKNSSYVFEVNINKNQKEFLPETVSYLAQNANDVAFPGYPYGLIQADKFARVSNEEKSYWLTLFQAHAGKKWEHIRKSLNIQNAHSILDNIG